MDSLTRLGPAEQGKASAEEAATVRVRLLAAFSQSAQDAKQHAKTSALTAPGMQRRLLIGGGLALATAAFALIPTDSLRVLRPSKALYLYLVPVLRAQVCRLLST